MELRATAFAVQVLKKLAISLEKRSIVKANVRERGDGAARRWSALGGRATDSTREKGRW